VQVDENAIEGNASRKVRKREKRRGRGGERLDGRLQLLRQLVSQRIFSPTSAGLA
jgi:hypothetical protein